MRELGLAPDPGEEKGIQGRGNGTHDSLERVCRGKSGWLRVEMLPQRWAGVGLPRALNAERSREARDGSLVKEDMIGVRRCAE